MSISTTMFIIRHGDTLYPRDSLGRKLIYGPDAPLTEVGIGQADSLALELKKRDISLDKIYTSPYARARQTADIILGDLDVGTLIEREGLVDIRGPHHIGLLWEYAINGTLPRFDDHETHEQVAVRMWQVYQEIYQAERGNSVGIVSHGDPIRVLLYRLVEGWGPLYK